MQHIKSADSEQGLLTTLARSGASRREMAAQLDVTVTTVANRLAALGLGVEQADLACRQRNGCSTETWKTLVANGATRAFVRQRQNAHARAIEWNLSLGEWWGIWAASGRWLERGRTRGGYVMGRRGDKGAYEVGNVEIIPNAENFRLAKENGAPGSNGVYLTVPGLAKPWVAYKRHRCLGYFATREEALAFRNCAS